MLRNCTLGNNESLAVLTYKYGVIILLRFKRKETIDLCLQQQIVLCYKYYLWVFLHSPPSINYRVVTVCMKAINLIVLNIGSRIMNILIHIQS